MTNQFKKYQILALTNNPTHAHEAVLESTFGLRPYTGVTATKNEFIMRYDDADITIKRFSGNFDELKGLRFDEVLIDNQLLKDDVLDYSQEEQKSLFYLIRARTIDNNELPHYKKREKITFFEKK